MVHVLNAETAPTSSPCSARDARSTVNWLVRPAASATPLQHEIDIQLPCSKIIAHQITHTRALQCAGTYL